MHENEFSILREIVIFPDHELSNTICTNDKPCPICNDARRRISIAVVWDGFNKKGIKLKELIKDEKTLFYYSPYKRTY